MLYVQKGSFSDWRAGEGFGRTGQGDLVAQLSAKQLPSLNNHQVIPNNCISKYRCLHLPLTILFRPSRLLPFPSPPHKAELLPQRTWWL